MQTKRNGFMALLIGFGLMAALSGMTATAAQMDLNTANEVTLQTLPGISKQVAKKIVANRPYATVNELDKAGVKNTNILEKIAPLVVQAYNVPKSTTPKGGQDDGNVWGRNHGRN